MSEIPLIDGMFCQVFNPAVAAHRGAGRRYPENSMAAIKEAINMAMSHPEVRFFIEMDVRTTRDGQLVLMHDVDVQRTTNGKGDVSELNLAHIQKLKVRPIHEIVPEDKIDCTRELNPFFKITDADMRVPTLNEVLGVVEKANSVREQISSPVGLAIEVKPESIGGGMFSRWIEPVLRVAAGMMHSIGFDVIANKLYPPPAAVHVLPELLNERAHEPGDAHVPILVFSSAGGLGKRDMQALWDNLSPKAQADFLPQLVLHEKGDTTPMTPYLATERALSLSATRPYEAILTRTQKDIGIRTTIAGLLRPFQKFWVVGTLTPHEGESASLDRYGISIITAPRALNAPDEIRAAIENHATLINSDRPERVIEVLETCQRNQEDVDGISRQMNIQPAAANDLVQGFVERLKNKNEIDPFPELH